MCYVLMLYEEEEVIRCSPQKMQKHSQDNSGHKPMIKAMEMSYAQRGPFKATKTFLSSLFISLKWASCLDSFHSKQQVYQMNLSLDSSQGLTSEIIVSFPEQTSAILHK